MGVSSFGVWSTEKLNDRASPAENRKTTAALVLLPPSVATSADPRSLCRKRARRKFGEIGIELQGSGPGDPSIQILIPLQEVLMMEDSSQEQILVCDIHRLLPTGLRLLSESVS